MKKIVIAQVDDINEMEIGTLDEWKEYDAATGESIVEKILDKNRQVNVDYNGWWDGVYEGFCEKANSEGFMVTADNISFSGFWSQGDGASFTCTVNVLDFIKHHKMVTQYRNLVNAIKNGKVAEYTEVYRSSHHYSHENTCSVSSIAVYEDVSTNVESNIDELEQIINRRRYNLCKELYKDLEGDYEGLTDDECVEETLRCNEYEFDMSGNIA